jgi:hypothetical protein
MLAPIRNTLVERRTVQVHGRVVDRCNARSAVVATRTTMRSVRAGRHVERPDPAVALPTTTLRLPGALDGNRAAVGNGHLAGAAGADLPNGTAEPLPVDETTIDEPIPDTVTLPDERSIRHQKSHPTRAACPLSDMTTEPPLVTFNVPVPPPLPWLRPTVIWPPFPSRFWC